MKAVLFDMDGTLVDTSEGVFKCVQYALSRFGMEDDDFQTMRRCIGPPLAYTFSRFYGFLGQDLEDVVAAFRERYETVGVYECQLFDGMEEVVRSLKAKGYRIGIASSKQEPMCETILETFHIRDAFDMVAGAHAAENRNSKEDVLHLALERWQDLDKSDMVLLGDSIYDVEGANSVGISTIAVRYGFGDEEEMLKCGAVALADTVTDIPRVVDAYFSQK